MRNLFQTGQKDREDGAVMNGRLAASQGDAAFVAGDDLIADPESETGSGGSFCGVEGLKERPLGSLAHAATCIGDDEPYSGRTGNEVRSAVDSNEKTTASRHGVKRIRYQVNDDLAKLTLVTVKRSDRVVPFFEDNVSSR